MQRLTAVRVPVGRSEVVIHDAVVPGLGARMYAGLSDLRIDAAVAELALGHAVKDELVRAYDLSDRTPALRGASERWSEHTARLVERLTPT